MVAPLAPVTVEPLVPAPFIPLDSDMVAPVLIAEPLLEVLAVPLVAVLPVAPLEPLLELPEDSASGVLGPVEQAAARARMPRANADKGLRMRSVRIDWVKQSITITEIRGGCCTSTPTSPSRPGRRPIPLQLNTRK